MLRMTSPALGSLELLGGISEIKLQVNIRWVTAWFVGNLSEAETGGGGGRREGERETQIDRQTDRQTTDRQTDRQTDRDRETGWGERYQEREGKKEEAKLVGERRV